MSPFILSLLISVTGAGEAPARISVVYVEPVEELNAPELGLVVTPSVPLILSENSWLIDHQEVWTIHEVAMWASAHSTAANLFVSERRALSNGLDHDDEKRSAQVGLSQAILRALGRHDRHESAAEAAKLPLRINGLQEQIRLLNQARSAVGDLTSLAKKAEELELADGDPLQFLQQSLALDDQTTQASFGIRKLRRDLARRTGKPRELADSATLSNQLDQWSNPNPADWLPAGPDDIDTAIAIAFANRADLEAVETLCRCMSIDSLPAARSMMAVLQPGLGLATSGGSKLAALHDLNLLHGLGEKELLERELACRRAQCRSLQQSARDAIEDQIGIASLDILEARQRLSIAIAAQSLAQTQLVTQISAVEIEKAAPGSDRTTELELLKRKGVTVERQVDLATARVHWLKVLGISVASVQPSVAITTQL